jgi:serine/threonine-protein kinase
MILNTTGMIGRYEILGEIGRGSMGVVFKARDPKIGRIVAIKTILLFTSAGAEQEEQRARFYEEARAAGRLSNAGIVTIFDVGRNPEDGNPYIVMEYVDGKPLNQLLKDGGGRLPLLSALRLAEEIAEALHFAHGLGVIHRDIKPENILVTVDGHPKIADFGIACLDQGHLTMVGQMLGSPAYMSPEQLEGESVDARSDLFSLGVVLYTMLTGHRPFQGNSTATVCFKLANRDPLPVSSWNLDFPLELDELVARAMAKDPEKRFQTAREMAAALRRFREAHEQPEQPLAGIMRIIGQETLSVPVDEILAEGSFEPESLHDVVDRALSQQSENKPALVAPEAVEVAIRKSGKPAAIPAPGKKMIRRQTFAAPRISGLNIGVVVLAVMVVVAGWAVWSHRDNLSGSQPTAQAEVAKAVELTQPPTQPAEDSSIHSESKRGEHENDGVAPVSRNQKHNTAPVRHSASVMRGDGRESPMPSRLPVTSKIAASAALDPDPASDMSDPSVAEKPVTVQMVHLSDLNVTIEHSFQDAEADISVDNRPVYTEALHGEKKRRALLFTRTQGRQSHAFTVLPGKHNIVVRVKSASDGYDASQSLTQGFLPGTQSTLLVRCDKRKNKLELSIQ